jgi:hypothetical protein
MDPLIGCRKRLSTYRRRKRSLASLDYEIEEARRDDTILSKSF